MSHFRSLSWLLAGTVIVGGASYVGAQAATVGQLVNVTGKVEVVRGNQPMKATLLLPLQKGDAVRVAPGGSAEVAVFGGLRFALAAGSVARVDAGNLAAVSGPKPTAKGGPVALAGSKTSQRILGLVTRDLGKIPVAPNGMLRAGTAPVLKWQNLSSPEFKQIEVRITTEEETIHKASVDGKTREYAVPSEVLKPGELYRWSVVPVKADGSLSELHADGLVGVLAADQQKMLEALERSIQEERQREPANPAPVLMLADTYRRLAMLDDYAASLSDAVKLRPQDEGIQAALKDLKEKFAITVK